MYELLLLMAQNKMKMMIENVRIKNWKTEKTDTHTRNSILN